MLFNGQSPDKWAYNHFRRLDRQIEDEIASYALANIQGAEVAAAGERTREVGRLTLICGDFELFPVHGVAQPVITAYLNTVLCSIILEEEDMATGKVNIHLGDVQKTLFLPLWGRAVESKKRKPMLVDETAVRIIQQVDYDFSQITQNMDQLSQIAWIRRSLFCDRIIKEFLKRYPEGTIVNIGCGLDTTFERIDNGKLKWYDLDLPDVIELRSKFVRENERRKFIVTSFLEKEWLEKIEIRGNVLFMAAGVFYYFEEAEIRDFMIRLIDTYPGSEILFDVSSPVGVRVANKKVVEGAGLDEKSYLTWGLEDKKVILAWDARIKILGTHFYFRTLQIGLRNILMGLLSDFLGIQYMLHLRLGDVETQPNPSSS